MPDKNSAYQLTNHLFRHEAGKMVAVLTRIFGMHQLQMAEDVVQDTLLQAFATWMDKGIPPNPAAWLYHVAKNKAVDALRRMQYTMTADLSTPFQEEESPGRELEINWDDELIADDMLRMMYACCHPNVPRESATALILKTLCGFSTIEIAHAFLCPDDTISKRLYRAKEIFRQDDIKLSIPSIAALKTRTEAVLDAIYLLFNEGYSATKEEAIIRRELMVEALRLCGLMITNPLVRQPEAYALMALMCFQASRNDTRISPDGHIILLADQDRSNWDRELIQRGNDFMNDAASGYHINSYHLQAAIAWEHCNAASFESTNWHSILRYYDWLLAISASPVTAINRVVAVMHVHGGAKAVEELERIEGREKLQRLYLYHAILGECLVQTGNTKAAIAAFEKAITLTAVSAEKELLEEKIVRICTR